MKFSVNKFIIDKAPHLIAQHNTDWETNNITNASELFKLSKKGYATAGAVFANGIRNNNNFVEATFLVIDIDNKAEIPITTIDDLLDIPIIKDCCWFVKTSASSTKKLPRYHLYFKLTQPTTEPTEYKYFIQSISEILYNFGVESIDKSVADPARLFFGNTKAEFLLINENNFITKNYIDKCIQQEKQDKTDTEQFFQRHNQPYTDEHIEFIVSLIKPRLNYDDWFRVVAAVGNTIEDDTKANEILTRYHPDLPTDKRTTLYALKRRVKQIKIGTLIRYATAHYVSEKMGVAVQTAFNNYDSYKNHFFSNLYNHFPELKPTIESIPIDDVFWYETSETKINKQTGEMSEPTNFKLQIDDGKLYDFIQKSGYAFLLLDKDEQHFKLIKVSNSIATEVNIQNLQNYLTSNEGFIRKVPEQATEHFTKTELLSKLRTYIPNKIRDNTINYLPHIRPNFLRDDKTTAYFTFINGIVVVKPDSITLRPYSEFSEFVFWKNKIQNFKVEIQRYINPKTQKQDNQFYDLLQKVCTNPTIYEDTDPTQREILGDKLYDQNRLNTLRSGIGYLLHNYKDPANVKTIVITEITTSDRAEGRTGKSLILRAIGEMRKRLPVDGKNLDTLMASTFFLQTLDATYDYVDIDDASRKFDLENLYSMLTSDLRVEKKFQAPFYIPFKAAPKFSLSTNYPLGKNNDSDAHRRHIIEIDRFFNKDNEPLTFYGKTFFKDWNDTQWNNFYNTMFGIVQEHLANDCKLIPYATDTLREGQLRTATNNQFLQFVEEILQKETWYSMTYLTNEWASMNGITKPTRSEATTIGIFINKYAEIYKGKLYLHKKRASPNQSINRPRLIMFSEKQQQNDDAPIILAPEEQNRNF